MPEHSAEFLLLASVLVGVAIVLDGSASRLVNGVAGLLWIASAGMLARECWRTSGKARLFGAIVLIDLVLVLAVRPSDLLWAFVGFAGGGALVALMATADRERTALLLPAMWLPLHLSVALIRAADRAMRDLPASVRADPPPTAALVPLTMVVAAYIGGWIVGRVLDSRRRHLTKSHAA
jgi:hypothetical protein